MSLLYIHMYVASRIVLKGARGYCALQNSPECEQPLLSACPVPCSWRGRMQVALHSTWFHLFVVILVLFDSLFVLIELLLEVGAFSEWRRGTWHHAVKQIIVRFLHPNVGLVV